MDDIFGNDELFSVFESSAPTPSSRKKDKKPKARAASPPTAQDDNADQEIVDTEKEVDDVSALSQNKSDDSVTIISDTEEDNTKTVPRSTEDIDDEMEVELISPEKSSIDTEAGPVTKKKKKQKSTDDAGPSTSKEAKKRHHEELDTEETTMKHEDTEDEDDEDQKRAKVLDDVEALQKYLPQVDVNTLETPEDSGCTHVVAVPKGAYYIPLHPIVNPVKTYKFKLDLFQERAVQCVDNYQSVLVSAHTSAGKTVVAEYAVAKGLKDNQRVIYTTPIKALSNQKYREFYEEFKDVGLITGDVTINPSAGCLIMTTEILRNMLYRGSEIMREVGWVIFDEIHYMRDKERGVVWEETIILLPQKTHYVFLSATIPNAVQFAQWITHLHKQPCNVIHTEYRPVPLHHYVFPIGSDGIHLVVDDHANFREEGFNTAMEALQSNESFPSGRRNPHTQRGEDSPCHKVIKMAMEHDLCPVIVFSFSKKDCEIYALQLSRLDFNSAEDKQLVEEVFTNAIDVLSQEDQKLPQVVNLLPLLKRGIGIHHGGLLPLLKETIEILFSEGLIKVLFATETFAMGLNMPARTVLFTSVRKFDGKTYRWITSGEYIQMSGRAGRRGIDDKGVCIVMLDEKISPSVGRGLLRGAADPINSAFHLTYNMVLNLMRVEEINPEFMMERSFYQFQNYSSIPALCEKLVKAEEDYKNLEVPREEEIASYYNLRQQLEVFSREYKEFITTPKYIIPFMQPGRLVYVKNEHLDFGWGAVVNFKRNENAKANPLTAKPVFVIEVLLHLSKQGAASKSTSDILPVSPGETGEMKVVPVALTAIQKISQVRLYVPSDLRQDEKKFEVLRMIKEVVRRFGDTSIPLLDPIKDMHIKDKEFDELVKNIRKYEARLKSHPMLKEPETPQLFEKYSKKVKLHDDVQMAKSDLKKAKSLLQMEELKCRKRVLRRLGFSSGDDVIELKGRVACELTSADELLLTEMIFNGLFLNLDVPQTVAVLSCLVCDERSNQVPKLSEELSGALKMIQDMARQIAKVTNECKLVLDETEYIDQFKPFLMDVVHAWCKGASFSKLCEMTEIFEGGIIRCMRRLEELLRQMSLAAKVIGNKELEEKFSEGVKLIKRDIVFAASLYL